MAKVKRIIFDLINGVYSDIPPCCNIFYSIKHRNTDYTSRTLAIKRSEYNSEIGKYNSDRLKSNYVLCDRCFENKRVHKIKKNGAIFRFLIK
jgi:hypothetical protein